MKTYKLNSINYSLKVPKKELDFWIRLDKADIHYCKEYNAISVYEYDKELDYPTHRYKTLETIPIYQ